MHKICIVTLGCPKNVVEAENIAGILKEKGHILTIDLNKADTALVHTCSFIRDAKRESEKFIKGLLKLKEKGKIRKIFVSGCLVQSEGRTLASSFPEVDGFLGTGELNRISSLIETGGGFICNEPGGLLESPNPRVLSSSGSSAYLKVSEGCSHKCSFCFIPEIRGRYKSRKTEHIVKEAGILADNGIKELVLVAQDVTSFGRDLYGYKALPKLIEKLAKIEGIEWIRMLYGYPASISNELIACFERFPKLCKYIDVPLQHISNRVLKNMGRPIDAGKIVKKLKEEIPDIAIRTSFIVGFPGETKKDFEKLKNFVKEGWFDNLGVFEYSDEKRTGSYKLAGKISEEEKRSRKRELMEAQKLVVKEKNKDKLNKVVKVLVEKKISGKKFEGRACFQAPEVDSKIIFSADNIKTAFVDVLLTGFKGYDLFGKKV